MEPGSINPVRIFCSGEYDPARGTCTVPTDLLGAPAAGEERAEPDR